MRAFAEFVMRGRMQATLVCVAFALLPFLHWVAAAVVALVVLRRGVVEGSLLVLWTILPLAAWYMSNNDASTMLVLIGTFGLAVVLRLTVSWELTLLTAVVVAGLAALVFEMTSGEVLGLIVDWYLEFLRSMKAELDRTAAQQVLIGFFALGQAFAMILALSLARWWQSLLYNPDGFQKEFHQLRLSPAAGLGLSVVMALLFAVGDPAFGRWIPLMTVPMVIPAIALVHWIVKRKQLSQSWIVTFYIFFLFMIQLIYPLLASIALLDSGMNFRRRIGSDKPD